MNYSEYLDKVLGMVAKTVGLDPIFADAIMPPAERVVALYQCKVCRAIGVSKPDDECPVCGGALESYDPDDHRIDAEPDGPVADSVDGYALTRCDCGECVECQRCPDCGADAHDPDPFCNGECAKRLRGVRGDELYDESVQGGQP